MLRRITIGLAAVAVLLTLQAPAALGGGSTFDFDGRYYMPGDRVTGETSFWIQAKDRPLLKQEFHAYLIRTPSWIEPPHIPAEAVPLGPVTIAAGEGGGYATLSFTVPDLPPGNYSVDLCDVPCRHSFLGDLMGGWITVVGSWEEIRLRRIIDRLESTLYRVESSLGRRIENGKQRSTTLQNRVDLLTREVQRHQSLLESALAGLAERPAPTASSSFDRAGWVVAVLALGALAVVLSRARRRSVPTAPELADLVPLEDGPEWRIEAAHEEEEDGRTPVGVR